MGSSRGFTLTAALTMAASLHPEIALDFRWDVKRVWALDIPVEDMAIEELEWHFSIPFWSRVGRHKHDLLPIDVIRNPEQYPEHYARIMNSDLSYPLDIMINKNGRYEMLDGLHRLVKHKLMKHVTVPVRKIPTSMKDRIRREE